MKFEVEIPDHILAEFSEWQRIYGLKLTIEGERLHIEIAADAAAVASAIRKDRTPRVATNPGDFGNIRWR